MKNRQITPLSTNSMATMVGGYESQPTPPGNNTAQCLAAAWGGGLTGLMGGYALGGGVWYLVGAAGGTLTGMAAHC